MEYELNVGLDVAGADNSGSARSARRYKASVMLDKLGGVSFATIGDLAGEDEPCLYAKGTMLSLGALGLIDVLYDVACELNQDCVAVAFPDGTGRLVGPRSEAWGEFNPEYFRRPEVA